MAITYLKKADKNKTDHKIFFSFDGDQLKITRLDGINLVEKKIEEISVYKFKNNVFLNSFYSNINQIENNKIIMEKPKIISSELIKDLDYNVNINLNDFGENFYNNEDKINLYLDSNRQKKIDLSKIIIFVVTLFTYISLFLSKKAIQKNTSVLKYTFISIMIFSYAFMTSKTYLDNYNILFQISVLLTFTFYLYKNILNE